MLFPKFSVQTHDKIPWMIQVIVSEQAQGFCGSAAWFCPPICPELAWPCPDWVVYSGVQITDLWALVVHDCS